MSDTDPDELAARETNHNGRVSNKELLDHILAGEKSAEDWRAKHASEAVDRNGALMGAIDRIGGDYRLLAIDAKEMKLRMSAIETTGVPLETSRLLKKRVIPIAYVITACAILLVLIGLGDAGFRVYSFRNAPVIRAPR
jgi:hypothetical protein